MLIKKPDFPISFQQGKWGPPGSHRYNVQDGDNWWTLAAADGQDPLDLIHFNFKTHNPKEVNWYLQNFVGCTKSTDGKNYSFSSTDSVKMNFGPPMRGHIFTKTRITKPTPVAPPTDHDLCRTSVLNFLNSTRFSRFNFDMFQFGISGKDFRDVKGFIENRRIRVRYNTTLTADGEYKPVPDELHLPFRNVSGLNRKGLVVHEITHAAMDARQAAWLNRKQSEGIAFVTQCLFTDISGSYLFDQSKYSITSTNPVGDDAKFVIGHRIAEKVLNGKRSVSKADEAAMIKALRQDSHYHAKSGHPRYNGISERRIDWDDPVIPYL